MALDCQQTADTNDVTCTNITFEFDEGFTLPDGGEFPPVDAVVSLVSELPERCRATARSVGQRFGPEPVKVMVAHSFGLQPVLKAIHASRLCRLSRMSWLINQSFKPTAITFSKVLLGMKMVATLRQPSACLASPRRC